MDILTQTVLGSALAPLVLPKENPRKAMAIGAVLGAVPDLDMILGYYTDSYYELVLHRSFSHAIIPFMALSVILLWFSKKLKLFPDTSNRRLIGAFFLLLFTHALLDCFTTWGTQLFWPFSKRIATQTIYVVDLFYSAPLGLAVLFYFIFSQSERFLNVLRVTLLISTSYILGLYIYQQALILNFPSRHEIGDFQRVNAQPGLFRPFQYRMVIERENDFLLTKGVHSLFDSDESYFYKLDKDPSALNDIDFDFSELEILSRGYLHVNRVRTDSVVLSDLRYGPRDLSSEEYESVFTYYLVYKNGEWKFSQNMRITSKLGILWQKILYESGLSSEDSQGR